MLDEFFLRALAAGVGLAVASGPLGCFIVWRGMAYLGDTMAHSALLGIALAVMLDLDPPLGVFAIALLLSSTLLLLEHHWSIPADALLGMFSHATLAIGLLIISFLPGLQGDFSSFLFGSLLLVSDSDVRAILLVGLAGVTGICWLWRPLLASTISPELAAAENLAPTRTRFIFLLTASGLIAVAIKIVGILLTTSLFIIPAITARCWSTSPVQMAVLSSVAGTAAVVMGLLCSLWLDTPSGPSIVVAALAGFLLAALSSPLLNRLRAGAPCAD